MSHLVSTKGVSSILKDGRLNYLAVIRYSMYYYLFCDSLPCSLLSLLEKWGVVSSSPSLTFLLLAVHRIVQTHIGIMN